MKRIGLHVHSSSLRSHLRYQDISGYDVFAFLHEMAQLGCTGVNISADGPGLRHLCGTTPAHLARVGATAAKHDLRLELDTSDTRPEHMTRMLHIAVACGADTLHTYPRYDAPPADVVQWTVRDLSAVAPIAADLGVLVVLENHERFNGQLLARILGEVAHPGVRALYDYGDSQLVGEDPLAALAAVAPYVARVHAKDQVLVRGPNGPVAQGVPFGTGNLPVATTTDRLYLGGVRRFCFASTWGQVTPLMAQPERLPDTACFAFVDPAQYLMGDALSPERALREERVAFDDGLAAFRQLLAERGYDVRRGV